MKQVQQPFRQRLAEQLTTGRAWLILALAVLLASFCLHLAAGMSGFYSGEIDHTGVKRLALPIYGGYFLALILIAAGLYRSNIYTRALGEKTTQLSANVERLDEIHSWYSMAVNTAKLGYWHFDEIKDEYIDYSDEYVGIFGFSREEFGERFTTYEFDMQLMHPDDKEWVDREYSSGLDLMDLDYRVLTANGETRYVREIVLYIRDESGTIIESMGTLQDITELKQAQEAAENASRAKSQFLSQMSHELRTPLNAIMGYAQLLELDKSTSEIQRPKAQSIAEAGQHLLTLIESILDLSRIESGQMELSIEPVSLQKILADSIEWVAESARKRKIEILFEANDFANRLVRADAIKLKQVFLNLLSNAVKFNTEQGKIMIDTRNADDGRIDIRIRDTGIGIPLEIQQEIFTPFHRLGVESSVPEGTGIGLIIVRNLVQLMGGELLFQSTEGEGSTFTVRMPESEIQASPARVESENDDTTISEFTIAGFQVLVAEDNPVNQGLLADQLSYLGFAATFANNGREAFKFWQAGQCDLLLTDIRMPEMDGYQLISLIREQERDSGKTPIIALTANSMQADIDHCIKIGADAVITKPVNLKDLKQAIEKYASIVSDGACIQPDSDDADHADDDIAVDLKVLTEAIGDSNEAHCRHLQFFVDNLPPQIEAIIGALEQESYSDIELTTHRLKSSASSMGAINLAALCADIESACREDRADEIPGLVAGLPEMAQRVTRFVGTLCEQPVAHQDRPREQVTTDSGICVLIVDDDPVIHLVTTSALTESGVLDVHSAHSGRAALDYLTAKPGGVDIILCDLNMPEMDGIELVRNLSGTRFTGAVVLSSGENYRILHSVEKLAIEHGLKVLGVVEKPITRTKILNLLEAFDKIRDDQSVWTSLDLGIEELSQAISDNQIEPYFQPKIDIQTRKVAGVETLVRWLHPTRGIIGPNAFIPMAEEKGLITELTQVVIRKAYQSLAGWKADGMNLNLALNVSVESLHDLEWPDRLESETRAFNLSPADITLEITESRLMEHKVLAMDILGRLSLKRFSLSIDDFGTGYSSMELLQNIPFSELKIDRAFVHNATNNPAAAAILESSMVLANKLNLKSVAEGVENQQDLDKVAEMGCSQAQGYYIAKPMSAANFSEWIQTQKVNSK